jgi:hypothetical protein
MKLCNKCLYSTNHPFGLNFNHDDVCTGCITHSEKFDLDWQKRFEKLKTHRSFPLWKPSKNEQ